MKKKVLLFSAVLLVSATLVLNSCRKEIYLINDIVHFFEDYSTGAHLDETPHSEVVFHYLSSGDFGSGMASNPYTSSDLSQYLPAVGNQGPTGSCVAWAFGYNAMTALWHINNPGVAFSDANTFSPNFLYNNTKETGEPNPCDDGTVFVRALEFMADKGCATLSTDPLNGSNTVDCDKSARPAAATAEAMQYALDDWQPIVATSDMIKQKLCLKYPVLLAADLPANFSDVKEGDFTLSTTDYNPANYSDANKRVDKDNNTRLYACGHAMLIIGHDDAKQAFRVRNSWGADWADNGDFWLPYSIVDDSWDAHVDGTYNWKDNPKFVNRCWIMEMSHHHTDNTITGGWDLDIDHLKDVRTTDPKIRIMEFDMWNNGDVATENYVKYEIWAYSHSTGEQTKLGEPSNPVPALTAGQEILGIATESYSTANLADGMYSIVLCIGSYDTDASLFTRNDIRWHNNHAAIQLHVVNGEGLLRKSNKIPKTKK